MNKTEIKALVKEAKATLKAYQKAFDKKYNYEKIGKMRLHIGICNYVSHQDYFVLEEYLDFNITGFICTTPEAINAKTNNDSWFVFWGTKNEKKYISKFKHPYQALEPRIDYLKKLIIKYENKISTPTTVNSK
jgi:hypothetical protein